MASMPDLAAREDRLMHAAMNKALREGHFETERKEMLFGGIGPASRPHERGDADAPSTYLPATSMGLKTYQKRNIGAKGGKVYGTMPPDDDEEEEEEPMYSIQSQVENLILRNKQKDEELSAMAMRDRGQREQLYRTVAAEEEVRSKLTTLEASLSAAQTRFEEEREELLALFNKEKKRANRLETKCCEAERRAQECEGQLREAKERLRVGKCQREEAGRVAELAQEEAMKTGAIARQEMQRMEKLLEGSGGEVQRLGRQLAEEHRGRLAAERALHSSELQRKEEGEAQRVERREVQRKFCQVLHAISARAEEKTTTAYYSDDGLSDSSDSETSPPHERLVVNSEREDISDVIMSLPELLSSTIVEKTINSTMNRVSSLAASASASATEKLSKESALTMAMKDLDFFKSTIYTCCRDIETSIRQVNAIHGKTNCEQGSVLTGGAVREKDGAAQALTSQSLSMLSEHVQEVCDLLSREAHDSKVIQAANESAQASASAWRAREVALSEERNSLSVKAEKFHRKSIELEERLRREERAHEETLGIIKEEVTRERENFEEELARRNQASEAALEDMSMQLEYWIQASVSLAGHARSSIRRGNDLLMQKRALANMLKVESKQSRRIMKTINEFLPRYAGTVSSSIASTHTTEISMCSKVNFFPPTSPKHRFRIVVIYVLAALRLSKRQTESLSSRDLTSPKMGIMLRNEVGGESFPVCLSTVALNEEVAKKILDIGRAAVHSKPDSVVLAIANLQRYLDEKDRHVSGTSRGGKGPTFLAAPTMPCEEEELKVKMDAVVALSDVTSRRLTETLAAEANLQGLVRLKAQMVDKLNDDICCVRESLGRFVSLGDANEMKARIKLFAEEIVLLQKELSDLRDVRERNSVLESDIVQIRRGMSRGEEKIIELSEELSKCRCNGRKLENELMQRTKELEAEDKHRETLTKQLEMITAGATSAEESCLKMDALLKEKRDEIRKAEMRLNESVVREENLLERLAKENNSSTAVATAIHHAVDIASRAEAEADDAKRSLQRVAARAKMTEKREALAVKRVNKLEEELIANRNVSNKMRIHMRNDVRAASERQILKARSELASIKAAAESHLGRLIEGGGGDLRLIAAPAQVHSLEYKR